MLAIAILAAGKGTRMKSKLPKVLLKLAGVSLVERVISSCEKIKPDKSFLVIGHQGERVKESLTKFNSIEFVNQQPQNGTGHAVQQLIPFLKNFEGELIVLNGDVPLLQASTIKELLNQHRSSNADVTLLTSRTSNPKGYGRVFTNGSKEVHKIIEDKDCNEEQRENKLTNSGIYCFNWKKLKEVLSLLSNKNAQSELYITDAIGHLGKAIHFEVVDQREVSGVNDRIQMAKCESYLQERLRNYWMNEGVTFTDPKSCTISENCTFGNDVIIEPQTHLRGNCKIGDDCLLGPATLIEDSIIGNKVRAIQSVIRTCIIKNNVHIGPFAHIRPEVSIENNCKIGNFVELKKSSIREGTSISHLSYIGDADVGSNVNIGAGTITANYDGQNKNKSIIGDNTKTGANSVLVAPIQIGANVTIGAGSTITKDVPSQSLVVERSRQITREGWKII
ncbi:bifunctional UDP-N-acetylglucosamine diphosphorylase/glucosamine-1-phosphate N-acetyltransferase GlmU [Prochlorococcus sp. MIT 1223]|uniref:bifunctional UDP-N-acetylglucosamine diphosphorylase/glucosamine-1-phosphate N-acetyltransferase GlmU n=1 Tax=Prochlorococcus sp. MIT 1223 TaxID=3096217 RepID=UPI002A763918|nr:bifunctional UDP-N-acetylglucosamine diphosphorylase/glucosamine-1-phosphate N-acetyltransferase GlmU [Prochlorococcus sp. MIT 1223]